MGMIIGNPRTTIRVAAFDVFAAMAEISVKADVSPTVPNNRERPYSHFDTFSTGKGIKIEYTNQINAKRQKPYSV
jgi:hypothetical protein